MALKDKIYQNKIQELIKNNVTPDQYISEYIKNNPKEADKITNLVKKYGSATIAKALVYKESNPSLFQEATSAFKQSASETFGALDALVGSLLGSDMYKQRAQQWYQQAEEYSNPETKDIFEVKNVSEVAHSLARMLGHMAEFAGETALGGLEGKLAKGAVEALAKKKAETSILENIGKEKAEEEVKKALVKKALEKAVTPETVGAYTQITLPEIQKEYQQSGNLPKSILGGMATGALFTLAPFKALKAVSKSASKEITDEIINLTKTIPSTSSPAIQALKEGIEQSAILATATATQEFGSGQPINPKDIEHSAILGGLLGMLSKSYPMLKSKKAEPTKTEIPKETKSEVKQPDISNIVKTTEEQTKTAEIGQQKIETQQALSELEKTKLKEPTAVVPKGKVQTKTEYIPKYESLIEKGYLDKPAKKDSFLHKRIIAYAFNTGKFKDRLEKDFDTAYKVIKSAGFSDKDILEKYKDVVTPDKYTPSMVKTFLYEDTPIDLDNINLLVGKAKFLSKFADKNPAISRALKDFNSNLKKFVIQETDKKLRDFDSLSEKDMVKTLKDIKSRLKDNPYENLITISALTKKLPDLKEKKWITEDEYKQYKKEFGDLYSLYLNKAKDNINKYQLSYEKELKLPAVKKEATIPATKSPEQELKPIFRDEPFYKFENNEHIFKVSEFEDKTGKLTDLQDELFTVEKKPDKNTAEVKLKNPYTVEIPSNTPKSRIPSVIYKKLFDKKPEKVKTFGNEIKQKLINEGYDGLVVIRKTKLRKYPEQVIKFKSEEIKEQPIKPAEIPLPAGRKYPYRLNGKDVYVYKDKDNKWNIASRDFKELYAYGYESRTKAINDFKSKNQPVFKEQPKPKTETKVIEKKQEAKPKEENKPKPKKEIKSKSKEENKPKKETKPKEEVKPKEKKQKTKKQEERAIDKEFKKLVKEVKEIADEWFVKKPDKEGRVFAEHDIQPIRIELTIPPEFKEGTIHSFKAYLKHIGIDDVYEERGTLFSKSVPRRVMRSFKSAFEARQEQMNKGVAKENMEAILESAVNIVKYYDGLKYEYMTGSPIRKKEIEEEYFKSLGFTKKINRMSYNIAKDFIKKKDIIHNELNKIFGRDIKDIIANIFGDEIAKKIKVKSISQLTLEDLGGRKVIEKTFRRDYNIDISHLTDAELLDTLRKNLKGSTLYDPVKDSILIMIAHHTDDLIGKTLYHELFHILHDFKYLKDKEVEIIKSEINKKYPNDTREWFEKAADDFAIYAINRNTVKGKIRFIYNKIRLFLKRIGFKIKQSPEDFYEGILTGKYKANSDALAYFLYRKDTLTQPRFSVDTAALNPFQKKLVEYSARDLRTFKEKAIEEARRVLELIKDFFLEFGRGVAPEAVKEGYIVHADAIRYLVSIKELAHHHAQQDLFYITEGLTQKDKFLLEQVLILRDIKYNLDRKIQTFANVNKQWNGIFRDEQDIADKLKIVEEQVKKNQKVQQALKRRKEVHNRLINYLKNEGYIGEIEDFDPDRYFHRITASYFNQKIKLKHTFSLNIPKIDVLRERKNSTEPYITDYIYSDYEALAQFHLLKNYDKVQKKLIQASAPTVQEMIRDYITVKKFDSQKAMDFMEKLRNNQVKLSSILDTLNQTGYKEKYKDFTVKRVFELPHFYTVWTLPHDLTEKLLDETLSKEEKELLIEKNLKQRVAVQKFTSEILLPKSVLTSINKITQASQPSAVLKFMQYNIALFKKFVLFSPFRFIKYSLNNFTSDMDILFAVDPSIIPKYGLQAGKDLYDYFYNKGRNLKPEVKKEIEQAIDNLVLGTNITSEEVISINNLEDFRDLFGTKPNIYQKWWKFSAKFNNYRESILRLATYRWYKEQLSKGKLEELPSIIDYKDAKKFLKAGLYDELAAKLTREIIGDYGNISPSGQWLRKNLIPFWSWTEVNIPRYVKLLKNSTKIKTKYGRLYPIVFAFKAAFLYSAITMFNYTFFPQASSVINDANNGQLHLILGQKSDGSYLTLRFQGSLNDALDWFGLGNLYEIANDIKSGKMSFFDVVKNMPVSAINKLVNMSSPIQKTIIEDLMGMSLYPDVFHPRVIRDKYRHALDLYGLGVPYHLLFSGDPLPKNERGLGNILATIAQTSLFYTSDLNTANYAVVRNLVENYLNKKDLNRFSIIQQEKSNYAFYYKKAIQYGDKEKAIHFLAMYYLKGGTLQSINRSIQMMNPLNMIPKAKLSDFYNSLTDEDKLRVEQYLNWFNDVFIKKSKFTHKELFEIYKTAYKLSIEMKRNKV